MAHKKRIPWLVLNDMAVLYEDAGMPVSRLASLFGLRKASVLRYLRLMGVVLRPPRVSGQIAAFLGTTPLDASRFRRPRSYASTLAFAKLRGIVGDFGVGVALAEGDRGGAVLTFPSVDAVRTFVELCGSVVEPDLDCDSFYTRIQREWRIVSRFVDVGGPDSDGRGNHSLGLLTVLNLAMRDVEELAKRL